MKKFFLISFVVLLSLIGYVLPANANYASDEKKNDLLILSAYSDSYRWSSNVIDAITSVAARDMGKSVSTINIPMVNVTRRSQLDSLAANLKLSLEANPPKAIVLVGTSVFHFSEDLNTWFPDIPMVFIGGRSSMPTKTQVVSKEPVIEGQNEVLLKDIRSQYNMTDQSSPIYLKESLDLIMKVRPNLKTLYYVGGDDLFSRSSEITLERLVLESGKDIEIKFLRNSMLDSEALLSMTRSLDSEKDAMLYSSWLSSKAVKGTPLLMNQMVYLLDYSNAPIFLLRDNGWVKENEHLLGGCFLNEEEYYDHLKKVIRSILEGRQARDIPDYTAGLPIVKFNYSAVEKFGISESSCPPGAIMIGKPEIFISRFKTEIAGVAIALLLLFLGLALLVLQKNTKLLQFSEYYQRLVNNMPLEYSKCEVIYDEVGMAKDFKVISVNKSLRNVYSSYTGRPINGTFLMSEYPDIFEPFNRAVNNAIRSRIPYTRFTTHNHKTGRYDEIVLMFNDDDTIDIFALNTTDLMKVREDLKQAKEKAEKSDRLKTQFVQNMSHEIRTPLNAIVGFSQLLALPDGFNTEEEKQEFSSYINSNSNMLMMLIDDILDLGDVENGNYRIEICESPCNEICRQAQKSVEYRTPDGVRMYYTTEVDDDYMIMTDPRRVQQVLINYLTNACKHTKEGEIHIHCSLSENPGHVTFSVTDTGTGIPAEQAENIFERFAKLDAFVQGAGLGLNICHTVAEKLGGEVKLDTSYTNGARFIFIL